ncbi:MAG TPA: D-2-hydroxyacid dehydrogenase [Clostridia bacterium]|nr:MAG: Glycerate dehydrogenase [Firmicutes bacterium ADurb.Bin146]HOD93679.1 D-2-hydroxyacid dehydrogenase [Clostridia bacterium]
MKIVLTDIKTVTANDLDLSVFEKFGEVQMYELTEYKEIADRIKYAEAVICNKTKLDANVLKNAEKLKYIGLFATGYNNIDVEYAKKKGITVCNAGSYSTNAVAQQTFAYILNHYSKLIDYSKFVSEGKWMKSKIFSPFAFPTYELSGKNIGIIGYGSIGRKVAFIAKAFDMNVYVYNRTRYDEKSVNFVTFDELLNISDIVTIHCPLNNDSYRMFNKDAFSKMKQQALFINTARGGIVDELALKEALENGIIQSAAIDVLTTEPMQEDCVLYNVKNLIITPHTAWIPFETRKRLLSIVISNLENFLNNKPTNVVSK